MRIAPGQNIPLWLRLWDGNPNRFILAHITDVNGVEQADSPFALTYSGNRGIYIGTGPVMGHFILISDYQTYLDSGFTQLDNAYLPASDWIEPDTGGSSSSSTSADLIGIVHFDHVVAITDVDHLTAELKTDEIQTEIQSDDVMSLQNTESIEGETQ